MYEPVSVSQDLNQIVMFAVLGFLLSAVYEVFRISRVFIKTSAVIVGIQDFLFLSVSGLVVFAYVIELGDGRVRLFCLAGVLFGSVVYFLTAGQLLIFLARTFANALKAVAKRVLRFINRVFVPPLRKLFIKIAHFIKQILCKLYKFFKKEQLLLKNKVKIMYNRSKTKNHETRIYEQNRNSRNLKGREGERVEKKNEIANRTIRAKVYSADNSSRR